MGMKNLKFTGISRHTAIAYTTQLTSTYFPLAAQGKLASAIKKSIYGLAAVELVAFGVAFSGFYALRRSEKSRQYLYKHFPAISKAYYWAEDSISFGQLTGSRLRVSDLRRWTTSEEADGVLETD